MTRDLWGGHGGRSIGSTVDNADMTWFAGHVWCFMVIYGDLW
jgi:hypothetical protein